jgi:2-polyprenyl-3-methyl-5-hydroxy-6-metoxy-1,4-benzoquinol methylase
MQINAASHLIRAARKLGLLDALRQQQRTLTQLCELDSLRPEFVKEILEAAVAIGIVEQYEDDYALSQAAHLLCQFDEDLGDHRWEPLVALARGESDRASHDDGLHYNQLAATQWIHTPAAMEAAEVLDFGGDESGSPTTILDLGCGSAVWTCAMAYRDPNVNVTAVDHEAALVAASNTAASIGISDRFHTMAADPISDELDLGQFDWVIVAQRLSSLGVQAAGAFLDRAVGLIKPGGRLVVIDLVQVGVKRTLNDSVEQLRLQLETREGTIFSPEQLQKLIAGAGLVDCQFALLSKGRSKLGLTVGKKA